MRGSVIVLALAALSLSACDNLEANAKRAVASRLKDPGSAQFRNLKRVEQVAGEAAICGEVNGKNSFGGYSGFEEFVYKGGSVYIGSDDVESIQARTRFCIKGGRSDEEWNAYIQGIHDYADRVQREATQNP